MQRERAKDPHQWREGYTTGSCAAGAAKAACALLHGAGPQEFVEIPLPGSGRLRLPVSRQECAQDKAEVVIVKDGGDDPDVTHGLEIHAVVRLLSPCGDVHLRGGQGIGTVTKKGLAVPAGAKAINPVPQEMIRMAVREVFPQEEIEVTIEVPKGESVAARTLNPRLGIVGGISILGTTGIVRPMSEEAFKASILPELEQALAYGHRTVVLTPGHYGFQVANERLGIPVEGIVQMGNFVGFLLEEAAYRGVERVLLLGHIGKLLKVAGGIFHTHNHVADARLEILVAHAALWGIGHRRLRALADLPTVEGMARELIEEGQQGVLHSLAGRASAQARAHANSAPRTQAGFNLEVGTVFTALNGEFLGWDAAARRLVQDAGWSWPVKTE